MPRFNIDLETNIVNYVSGVFAANNLSGSFLAGVTFSGVKTPPMFIASVPTARKLYPNFPVYECEVNCDYITQIDANNSYNTHLSGVSLAQSALLDKDTMSTTFTGLRLYGVIESDYQSYIAGENERSYGQHFKHKFYVSN